MLTEDHQKRTERAEGQERRESVARLRKSFSQAALQCLLLVKVSVQLKFARAQDVREVPFGSIGKSGV